MLRFTHAVATLLGAVIALFSVVGATPTHLRGVRQVGTGSQDARLYSWEDQIQWLDANRTLFTQVGMKLGQKKVYDPELKIRERQHASRWVRAAEAIDASETDISVATGMGKAFRVNDIVLIPETTERVLVTSISGDVLTVTRAVLGTTGTATSSGTTPWLKILFSKESEGGAKPTFVTTDPTTVTNWTQIFKAGWGQTGTDKATRKRGGTTIEDEQKMALERLREDMEQAFLWGKKREEVSSGTYTRYTGGIDEFVTTNRIDMEGGLGYGDVGYLMNIATRFGGPDKIWLCGRDARQQLNSLNLQFLQVPRSEDKLGMVTKKLVSSFGEAAILTHHGLDNAHAGHIFVIDPKHVRIANLREIKAMRDVQTPGTDGDEHYYLTEKGLWIDTEQAHMVIYNVTNKVT